MKVWLSRAMVVSLATFVVLQAAAAPDDLTIVGGHVYRFPTAVFEGGVVERGKVAKILLQVKWPSMEGLKLIDRLSTDAAERLLVLGLSNVNGQPYPDEELAKAERQAIVIAIADYGTPGFPLQLAAPGSEHGPVPGKGMIMVEAHPIGREGVDVFVAPSLETPLEMISCNRADDVFTNPQCNQWSVSRGMLLNVSYNRPMVTQWREIDAALEHFLASHEVTP